MKEQANKCRKCDHLLKPGRSDGYCGSLDREDLDKVYGVNHPARKLPEDFGENCKAFEGVR